VTGSFELCSAVTIFAFVAVNTTLLLVAAEVTATVRTSAASTVLSAGTGTVTAFAAVVPSVAGLAKFPPERVTVAADAGVATTIVATSASAEAMAIKGFFNEVIYFFSLFI
jgi:hypothetical protein